MGIVLSRQGAERSLEGHLLAIPPELPRQRLRHIAAPSTWAGDLIDGFHQLLWEHQVRAHIHAHMVAHGTTGGTDLAP